MKLATSPLKGQRRSLDILLLAKLEQEGRGALPPVIPQPPPALSLAVTEFNEGQYWQCHETLEEIWMSEEYPLRLFYHGLIKAAVGLLHLERNNLSGARLKLKDAERTLAPFIPGMMGLDVADLLVCIKQRLTLIDDALVLVKESLDLLPAVPIPALATHASDLKDR